MKVDMKNLPDEKKKPGFGRKQAGRGPVKKPFGRKPQDEEPEQELPDKGTAADEEDADEESTGGTGNVYRDNFNMYKEQYSKKLKNANLLQNNKFWIAVIVVLFFVFLSVNSNMSKARNQLTVQLNRAVSEYDKVSTAVAELKAELEEQARIDSIVLSNEEEELARTDAKVQGAFVADLQNDLAGAGIELGKISVDLENMGEDSDARTALVEKQRNLIEKQKSYKEKLKPYFADNSSSMGPGAWYKYLATGIPGKWEFASNASFKGDTMKVLWFLYADDPENPKDHSLLAYCTAVYNATDKTFHDVQVMTTTYADANAEKYSKSEEYVPDGSGMSIKEQLEQLGGGSTPPAGEEYENGTISDREGYKEQVMNGEVEGEEFDSSYMPGLHSDNEDSERSE